MGREYKELHLHKQHVSARERKISGVAKFNLDLKENKGERERRGEENLIVKGV